jgi:hypothetical protein
MTVGSTSLFAAIALALSGCVSASPLVIGDDNPASPTATSGLVETSTAIDDYKSGEDFAGRAESDAKAQPPGHMSHGGMAGMKGMDHGDMHHDGMHHHGASQGGAPQ